MLSLVSAKFFLFSCLTKIPICASVNFSWFIAGVPFKDCTATAHDVGSVLGSKLQGQ